MINLEYNIPRQFRPLADNKTRKIVESSGRSSGKSTSNEEVALIFMLQSKFNNIWYCRAESGDLRRTVFSSMLATIQAMDLDRYFKASLSPIEITCIKSGAKCYFSGINGKVEDDLNATKGFTPQYRTLKMFIVDEVNEVKFSSHVIAAETTANKFLIEGSKIVYAYNPPPLKTHWSHSFFADMIRNGADKIYTTWQDIKSVLKPATIGEILSTQKNDPLFYRYWYLGEVVNFSGMVYPQFNRKRHCLTAKQLNAKIKTGDRIHELIFGLDEGTVNDSTCVTVLGILMSGVAVVLDLYEYSPTDRTKHQNTQGQLSPSEQSRELWKWLKQLFAKFNGIDKLPRKWIFECAEGGQMLRNQFVQDYGEPTCLVTNKSIWGDVKRIRNMLSEDILYFLVDPSVNTEQLCEDIENYVIDEKTNDIKKNQREDSIDSLEYATKLYYDRAIAN